MGSLWSKIDLNASPLSEVVTAQKPQIVTSVLGLRSLWSTDSVRISYQSKAFMERNLGFTCLIRAETLARVLDSDPRPKV